MGAAAAVRSGTRTVVASGILTAIVSSPIGVPAWIAAAAALSLTAVRAQQQPDPETLLDALRTSVAEQEKAAHTVAFSAYCQTTIGEERKRGGELRVRVVFETKPNGNAHVWFDPLVMQWAGHEELGVQSGETVHRGSANATLFVSSIEGRPGRTFPVGTVDVAFNQAYGLITDAGGDATWWPLEQHRMLRTSDLLRQARAEDVHAAGDEVEVRLAPSRAHGITFRFVRHGERYALRERRETAGATVIAQRVVEDQLVADRVWLPRRVERERFEPGATYRTEIVFTDVKLDPVLDPQMFTIVAPEKTFFSSASGGEQWKLSDEVPELRGVVKLATDAVKRPTPPTAAAPEPGAPAAGKR